MNIADILDYYTYAAPSVGAWLKDQPALSCEEELCGAVVELDLQTGVPLRFRAQRADGLHAQGDTIFLGEAAKDSLPAALSGAISAAVAEAEHSADGTRTVRTGKLKPQARADMLRSLGWDDALPFADEPGALVLRFGPEGKLAQVGFRLISAGRAGAPALLERLREAGFCSPQALSLAAGFVSAYPSYLPAMYNRLELAEVWPDGRAIARLTLNEQEDFSAPAFRAPVVMNLELTTRCPLRCPQCYCELNTGKDLALDTALYWIDQMGKNRVAMLNLSGGETLCYPHLYEIIQAAAKVCPEINVALSGWGFDETVLQRLIHAGVSGIYISLNAPTEAVNALSRDGYPLAIRALEILRDAGFPHTHINWVMHNNNGDTLPGMLALAEAYRVETLAVMAFKPDASHMLPSLPTGDQMRRAARLIKEYDGPVNIEVEGCFSPMRALVYGGFLMNRNQGIAKGCGAGRDSASVNVDGLLSPCRHLEYFEPYATLEAYWRDSPVLQRLRQSEDDPRPPCASCRLWRYCRHCIAINSKLNGEIYLGNETCPLAERKQANDN